MPWKYSPPEFRQTNAPLKEIIDLSSIAPDLNMAIRNHSTYAGIHNSLAWLLATCPDASLRNGKEAVELATKACDLTHWINPGYLDTLAAAQAEAGDFNAAVHSQQQALDLLKPDSKTIPVYKKRILLYQSHTAYHQDVN